MSAARPTASAITPISAPWRSSPASRRRRNVCSTSVAAANRPRQQFGAARLRSLPGHGADVAQRGIDVAHPQARFGGGFRQRAQRRPPDADLPLRELAGQPRHDDSDQPGVIVGSGQPQQVGDAGDLGEPRRGRSDVGGRAGDVYEQHPTTLARGADNTSAGIAFHARMAEGGPRGMQFRRGDHRTAKVSECQPVAPSGTGSARSDVCV